MGRASSRDASASMLCSEAASGIPSLATAAAAGDTDVALMAIKLVVLSSAPLMVSAISRMLKLQTCQALEGRGDVGLVTRQRSKRKA